MLRVMVADDEIRICKLIIKLIDWEQIGMTIVGTASNGMEALEVIEREKPDIVITDIRMPGYDGLELIERAKSIDYDLEFIIISGYGQFEYAKKAIEYGVKDYLLKPINKEELLKTLLKVKEHITKKRGQIDLEKEYKSILKEDIHFIRSSFLNNLFLLQWENLMDLTLHQVNQKYHFNFQEAFFCIAALKIDTITSIPALNIQKIMDKVIEDMQLSLGDITYELGFLTKNNNLYVLVNYKKENKKHIDEKFKRILKNFNQAFLGKEKLEFTLAYGKEVEDFRDIRASYQSANLSIEDRILKGTGRIIYWDEGNKHSADLEEVFADFSKKFIRGIELLSIQEIEKAIYNFKDQISGHNIRGVELKNYLQEMGNIYYITMKKNKIKIDKAWEKQQALKNNIENGKSADALFRELVEHFSLSLSVYHSNKSRHNIKQICEAKKYIEANYMHNITLEDLGKHIGFNPSYFSSLFKRETGISFVEYLSQVRMEKAKDLLRESDLRIQDICLMVGYNDPKYFAKSFMKHTGLKPKEYRKIFA